MEKYSILSVDSNPDYLFFVPLACAFWRKLGYKPYVILVEDQINKEVLDLILEFSASADPHINFFKTIEGYRTCNVAQISRLYAAADPIFNEDDYLIVDDMDKLVIADDWFNQQDHSKDIHIYDPDELDFKRLKMGNIGMKTKVWKEVLEIQEDSLRGNLTRILEKYLSPDSTWDDGWNLDEFILTNAVFKSKYYNSDNSQFFCRGANQYGGRKGRICRSMWPQTFEMYMKDGLIDVHLHRDPWESQIWNDTKTIVTKFLGLGQTLIFENFKNRFMALLDKRLVLGG